MLIFYKGMNNSRYFKGIPLNRTHIVYEKDTAIADFAVLNVEKYLYVPVAFVKIVSQRFTGLSETPVCQVPRRLEKEY